MSSLKVLSEEKLIDFRTFAEYAPVMLWLTNNDGDNIFSNSLYKTFIGHKNVEALGAKGGLKHYTPKIRKPV